MGRIMVLNGSPRASKSNSRRYADIFIGKSKEAADYFDIKRSNHSDLCDRLGKYSDVLMVFPLYADGIPVTMLNFLKTLETRPPDSKPAVSVLINCGFIESEQNDTAVMMMGLFCRQNGYKMGSVLKIGSGEAILDSPFRPLVSRKIKKLADSIYDKKYILLDISMPLPKFLFLKASTRYWIRYGEKNGISEEEMRTMKIE